MSYTAMFKAPAVDPSPPPPPHFMTWSCPFELYLCDISLTVTDSSVVSVGRTMITAELRYN